MWQKLGRRISQYFGSCGTRKKHSSDALCQDITVERLEERKLLAGDVNVRWNAAGDLRITGTADDNELLITENAGMVQVIGLGTTTVNGQPLLNIPNTALGIIGRNLVVNMKAGRNYVEVERVSTVGDVRLRTGAENDTIGFIQSQVGDDFIVNTGSGDDVVAVVRSFFNDTMKVTTAGDSDAVGIVNCNTILGRAVISTGADADGVYLGGTYHGRLTVNLGSADDILAVQATAGGGITRMTLGSGDDVVYVHQATSMPGSPTVVGGGGTDMVHIGLTSVFSTQRFRTVETSVIGFFDTEVNNAGLLFAAAYTLRGGNPADLIC